MKIYFDGELFLNTEIEGKTKTDFKKELDRCTIWQKRGYTDIADRLSKVYDKFKEGENT